MEKFIITGGKKLHGTISVKGAKNHALKMIPAAFLVNGRTVIKNIPHVEDVERMLEIVAEIGGKAERLKKDVVAITPPKKFNGVLPRELMPKLRASLVLLGPLLARYQKVILPHPGGCNLGKRPINFFIEGFKEFGAKVILKDDAYQFSAAQGLKAIHYIFPQISVTGTETLMLAAILAKGKTILENTACEPEIKALADYLNSVGAKISGAGTSTITIEGSNKLLNPGIATIIPDRIETGSFVILAAATKSDLTITDCEPQHIAIPLKILEKIGVKTKIGKNYIKVLSTKKIKPIDVTTHEYPGFPTDLQAPMTVLLTQAAGDSIIRETIYEGRLFYTDSLNNMGAKIYLASPFRAIVHGATALRGKKVVSPDIRAGIAMIIASLIAKGKSEIENIYQVDRGYEDIDERLQKIGAQIKRIKR